MLNYTSHGMGKETVVFIHGFCENNTCFDKQVLLFKAGYNVICPDLPGFGKSPVISDVTMEDIAEEIDKVLKHVDADKCIMFGHSMGGYVTLAYAALFPHKLKGFGLIHSTSLPDNDDRKKKRTQALAFIDKNGKEAYLKSFIPGLFTEAHQSNPYVNQFINEGMKGPQEGIEEAIKAMMQRPDRTEILSESDIPVFFGIGKHDQLIPEDAMLKQASLCKQSSICYLEDSAHMSMVEEADKLGAAMLQFAGDIL